MSLAVPTSLNKTQKRKVSPAAKFVLSSYYQGELKVPKWSDIGTLVQRQLREDVVKRLRDTDSGDVAEYLNVRHDELEKYIHQRVRSMREARNCNGIKGRSEKSSKDFSSTLTKPQTSSTPHRLENKFREFANQALEHGMEVTTSSESSPLTSDWNKLALHTTHKEQNLQRPFPQSPSQTWDMPRPWENDTGHEKAETARRQIYPHQSQISQTSYTLNAPYYTEEGIDVLASDRQQSNRTTLAYRGIELMSSSTSGMQPLESRPRRRPKTHQGLAKVEETHEEMWDPKWFDAQSDSRKRKRVRSGENETMKAAMTRQMQLDNSDPWINTVPESASCKRFCYICDSVRCHHTITEQASSPKALSPLCKSLKDEVSVSANAPRDMPIPVLAQRRHTTDIPLQSMYPLSRTATEPRPSLQLECRSVGSQALPANRLVHHHLSVSSATSTAADSGYSTGSTPGTRNSSIIQHDPPLCDGNDARYVVDILQRDHPTKESRPGARESQGKNASSPQKSPFQVLPPLSPLSGYNNRTWAGLTISDEHAAGRGVHPSMHERSSRESTPSKGPACL